MNTKHIPIIENIMSANDQIAQMNRNQLDTSGVFSINIMASPGAGKTSLIEATIKTLARHYGIAVIEGDVATSIDSERIQELGITAVQINTGGSCHLEAIMFQKALAQLDLSAVDVLFVENVGNLICPSGWALGTHKNVLIASVPEGDDKPYKYPAMYRGVDALILNKIDLLPYVPFDEDYFRRGVLTLNPNLGAHNFFEVSCRTGEGIDWWLSWIRSQHTQQIAQTATL